MPLPTVDTEILMVKFDPLPTTPEWTDGKMFGRIDYVIDLNNLVKFGLEKVSRDGGKYNQHIRVRPF